MKVVVFFVCLCFLLLKVDGSMYATAYHNGNNYLLTQHVEKNNALQLTSDIQQDYTVIKATSAAPEQEYFVSDVVEDEDVHNFSVPKSKSLVKSPAVPSRLSYPSIVNYPCNYLRAPSFFFGQVSYKYILQGVLRI